MTSKLSFDALEGAQSLYRAGIGDISVLLERLRSASYLLDEERQLLADLIEGKRSLPQNRPAKLATQLRDDDMVETFLIERAVGTSPKAAERVAYRFGVSTRHLHRIHRQLKDDTTRYERLMKHVRRQAETYNLMESACRQHAEGIQRRWDERRQRRRQMREQGGP